MERCRTPHEFVDLVVDGALVEPFDEGVEEEPVRAVNRKYRTYTRRKENALITPICILLPPIQLIIDSERYTFFEPALGVGRPSKSKRE